MKVYLSGTNVVIEGGILVTPATFPAPQSDYTITGPSGSETILIEDLSYRGFLFYFMPQPYKMKQGLH